MTSTATVTRIQTRIDKLRAKLDSVLNEENLRDCVNSGWLRMTQVERDIDKMSVILSATRLRITRMRNRAKFMNQREPVDAQE